MWILFENPAFPFLNAFFKSDFMDEINFADKRYLPTSLTQYLFYPFIWAISICDLTVSDYQFIDFRFALAYIIGFFYILRYFFTKKSIPIHYNFLIVFLLISYIIWLTQFSILRYAIPIEILLSICIVKFFKDFLPKQKFAQIFYLSFMLILFGILSISSCESALLTTIQRNENKVIDVEPIDIPENSLILLYRMPSAGVLPSLIQNKKNIRIIAMDQRISNQAIDFDLTNHGKFFELKSDIIKNHTGNIVVIIHDSETDAFEIDTSLLKNKKCRKLLNSFNPNLQICM